MRFFRDISAAAGAFILVAVLFELGLRAAGAMYESSLYESDPTLYMALRPKAEGWEANEGENFVTINSWGMRDREHSLTPSPGTTRIALLGDSMVAAQQVPLDKTMARVLEAKLQTQPGSATHPIEVLNFGVGGYTLAQEFLLLQNRVWEFHPGAVILFLSPSSVPSCNRRLYPANVPFFVLHNGQVVPDPANRPPAASSPEARRRHTVVGDLMNRVRLLQLMRKATQDGIPQEIAKLEGVKPARNSNIMNMWLRPPSSPEQERAWVIADGILGLMAESAREHGADLWVSAIGPEIEENPNSTDRANFLRAQGITSFDYSEKRLQSLAAARGIKFISLESRLVEYAERNHLSLRGFFNTRPNYGHWNESGNAAAAAIVAESLLQGRSGFDPDERSTQNKLFGSQGGS